MLIAFLTSTIIPLIPPVLVHLMSEASTGKVVKLTHVGEASVAGDSTTFLHEMPLALFANSIWGMTYHDGVASPESLAGWFMLFAVLCLLHVILLAFRYTKRSDRSYRKLVVAMSLVVVAITFIRIISPDIIASFQ